MGWQSVAKDRTLIAPERWQRIIRIMDETFADYLTGMAALRGRVAADLKRKLSDSKVLDHPRQGARSRSAPARKRR